MKHLLKLTMLSSALVVATASQATTETHLIGQVDEICEVNIGSSSLDFGINPQAGDALVSDVSLRCNDGDGATVRVQSSEGGLESDDNEDLSIEYTAALAAGAVSVVLETTPGVGNNDEFEEVTLDGSLDLARGIGGTLTVTLLDTPVFAGGYSDTLSVDITPQ